MVRLAAFDMDGTLLLPDHQLGQQTLDSLQALHLRGVNWRWRRAAICWRCRYYGKNDTARVADYR